MRNARLMKRIKKLEAQQHDSPQGLAAYIVYENGVIQGDGQIFNSEDELPSSEFAVFVQVQGISYPPEQPEIVYLNKEDSHEEHSS